MYKMPKNKIAEKVPQTRLVKGFRLTHDSNFYR